MLDPLIVFDPEITGWKERFGLAEIDMNSQEYFITRKILRFRLGITNQEIEQILDGFDRRQIVSGFGLTGEPHLGIVPLMDELRAFAEAGCSVSVFLSEADSLARSTERRKVDESRDSFSKFLTQITRLPLVSVHTTTPKSIRSLRENLLKSLPSSVFSDIFEIAISESARFALIDMAASILGMQSEEPCLVVLGVDEFLTAILIRKCAAESGVPIPSFLFNDVLLGYDRKKMGKSRAAESFSVVSDPVKEFSKLLPRLNSHQACATCPGNHIRRFSKHGRMDDMNCEQCHFHLSDIMKKESYE